MSKGIYGYYDKENNYIPVNIGKDSHIDESRRHKQHLQPSFYDAQPFNRALQNNPDRYEYRVICEYPNLTDEELNWFECMEIMKHKFLYGERPKFNFTVGGDGITGYRKSYEDFEYKVVKAGKDGFTICGRSRQQIKMCKDRSKLEPIAEALNNGEITEEEAKEIKIKLNPFVYTVVKAGKNGFQIYGRSLQPIKTCKDKSKLEPIAEALNNGEITESIVKSTRGVNRCLKFL